MRKPVRNQTLDIIRGFLLIIMTIDHFSGQIITSYVGYFSAAEGFVFVSGMVMGIYFISKYVNIGEIKNNSSFIKRGVRIYKYHIITLLFYLAFKALEQTQGNWFSITTLKQINIFQFLWGALLIYKPFGLDILPMYILFIILAPYLINLILKNKVSIVLIISISLWLLSYLFIETSIIEWKSKIRLPITGAFNFFSWQLLFVLGMLSGFYAKSQKMNFILKNKFSLIISCLFILFFFLLKHQLLLVANSDLMKFLTDRTTLGPLRIINFFSIAYLIFFLLSKIDLSIYLSKLALLGQHSIQVFTFHLLVLIVLRSNIPLFSIEFFESQGYYQLILNNLLNWFLTFPIILFLFVPVKLYKRYKSLLELFPSKIAKI